MIHFVILFTFAMYVNNPFNNLNMRIKAEIETDMNIVIQETNDFINTRVKEDHLNEFDAFTKIVNGNKNLAILGFFLEVYDHMNDYLDEIYHVEAKLLLKSYYIAFYVRHFIDELESIVYYIQNDESQWIQGFIINYNTLIK
eukprot:NODE_927_length_3038_cov_0.223810.p2 type:complete len:142 gc:universal NODE_927_length_3038_cov_0.223810:1356-1781(+)